MLGYGASTTRTTWPSQPEATGVAAMMRAALERSEVEPGASATSTPRHLDMLGDAAETRAIKQVFGDHAYELAVSSTKS